MDSVELLQTTSSRYHKREELEAAEISHSSALEAANRINSNAASSLGDNEHPEGKIDRHNTGRDTLKPENQSGFSLKNDRVHQSGKITPPPAVQPAFVHTAADVSGRSILTEGSSKMQKGQKSQSRRNLIGDTRGLDDNEDEDEEKELEEQEAKQEETEEEDGNDDQTHWRNPSDALIRAEVHKLSNLATQRSKKRPGTADLTDNYLTDSDEEKQYTPALPSIYGDIESPMAWRPNMTLLRSQSAGYRQRQKQRKQKKKKKVAFASQQRNHWTQIPTVSDKFEHPSIDNQATTAFPDIPQHKNSSAKRMNIDFRPDQDHNGSSSYPSLPAQDTLGTISTFSSIPEVTVRKNPPNAFVMIDSAERDEMKETEIHYKDTRHGRHSAEPSSTMRRSTQDEEEQSLIKIVDEARHGKQDNNLIKLPVLPGESISIWDESQQQTDDQRSETSNAPDPSDTDVEHDVPESVPPSFGAPISVTMEYNGNHDHLAEPPPFMFTRSKNLEEHSDAETLDKQPSAASPGLNHMHHHYLLAGTSPQALNRKHLHRMMLSGHSADIISSID